MYDLQRSTALTAAVGSSGLRVYTKTKDGDVREGCNDTTELQLLTARGSAGMRELSYLLLSAQLYHNTLQAFLIMETAGIQVSCCPYYGSGRRPFSRIVTGELCFRCSPDSTLCALSVGLL